MTENLSKFETGQTIIVKRGSKAIESGTEVRVLAQDTESGKYAVQTATGGVYSLAAERLACKPERTFTASEIAGLIRDSMVDNPGEAPNQLYFIANSVDVYDQIDWPQG